MAAGILSSQTSESTATAGLRRINIRTDLHKVADLLEMAFGPSMDASGRAMIREMRTWSRSGPLLWALAGVDKAIQGLIHGYVWEDPASHEIIGNVSLYPAGYGAEWIVANVAVHPGFRRQGIAHELMDAVLDDVRSRQVERVVLQVELANNGARQLYEQLGFKELRTFTRWRRRPYTAPPTMLEDMPQIKLRQRGDWVRQLALAEKVRSNAQGGMGWLRPTRKSEFNEPFWKSWGRMLGTSQLLHWVVRDEKTGELQATMKTQSAIGQSYIRADMLVAPENQGDLERPLMNFLVRYWYGRNKGILITHPADDMTARTVLRDYDFEATHHFTHMEWRP